MVSVDIYSGKDSGVYSLFPTNTYGSDTTVSLREDPGNNRVGYPHISFDTSGIPAGSTITSCTLRIWRGAVGGSPTVTYERITGAWTESALNWNNKPSITTTNSVSNALPTSGTDTINVTNQFIDAFDLSIDYEVRMRSNSATNHSIGMREYPTSTERPRITVVYTVPVYDDYYVRASGGNDGNSGTSWTDAWATVNKGMVTIDSGKTLHIGFDENSHADWYDSEPADNKLSPDASNVTVVYETAVTGGGTGYAKVEVN